MKLLASRSKRLFVLLSNPHDFEKFVSRSRSAAEKKIYVPECHKKHYAVHYSKMLSEINSVTLALQNKMISFAECRQALELNFESTTVKIQRKQAPTLSAEMVTTAMARGRSACVQCSLGQDEEQ
eukprot:IDg1922t1